MSELRKSEWLETLQFLYKHCEGEREDAYTGARTAASDERRERLMQRGTNFGHTCNVIAGIRSFVEKSVEVEVPCTACDGNYPDCMACGGSGEITTLCPDIIRNPWKGKK